MLSRNYFADVKRYLAALKILTVSVPWAWCWRRQVLYYQILIWSSLVAFKLAQGLQFWCTTCPNWTTCTRTSLITRTTEFEFLPDPITNYWVSCPWAFERLMYNDVSTQSFLQFSIKKIQSNYAEYSHVVIKLQYSGQLNHNQSTCSPAWISGWKRMKEVAGLRLKLTSPLLKPIEVRLSMWLHY